MPQKNLSYIKTIWPKEAKNFGNVLKYLEKYKNDLIVIKYGGNVLIDRNIFNNFINDINILNNLGLSIIVVHGGGPRIERELKKKKIQSKFINGLRVTDKNVISIVEKVLIDFNNDIVDSLNKKGSRAVSINSKVNNIIKIIPDNEELGYVGIPQDININFLKNLIKENKIPVVAPLGLDENDNVFKVEVSDNDWVSELNEGLIKHGMVQLGFDKTRRNSVRKKLISIIVDPIGIGSLQLYPKLENLEKKEDKFLVTVSLREQI